MRSFLHSRVAVAAAALIGVAACMAAVEAQIAQRAPAAQRIDPAAAADLEVIQLRSNFFMIAGAGGNIAVQVGEDGVLITDTGLASRADAVLAALEKISPAPIRYIANTSADPDHVGGNEAVANAGQTLFGGWTTGNAGGFGRAGASIVATEKVLHRMSNPDDGGTPYPDGGVADRGVLPAAEVHVLQRRGGGIPASAGGAHRR